VPSKTGGGAQLKMGHQYSKRGRISIFFPTWDQERQSIRNYKGICSGQLRPTGGGGGGGANIFSRGHLKRASMPPMPPSDFGLEGGMWGPPFRSDVLDGWPLAIILAGLFLLYCRYVGKMLVHLLHVQPSDMNATVWVTCG